MDKSTQTSGSKDELHIFGRPWTYQVERLGPIAAVIIFAAVVGIIEPRFLSARNVINVLYQAATYIILAVGMTFVITGAGIDISIGSMLALTGILMVFTIEYTPIPPWLGIWVAPLSGMVLGLFNGLFITKLKVPDFIATIATMIGYRGIVLIMAGGVVHYRFPAAVRFLGAYRIFGLIPISILVAFAIGALGYYVYNNTYFGRYTAALGGNRESAILAGIEVDKYKIMTYVFMGFLAGVAALVTIGRLDAFHATYGEFMEIDTIAAVIIGGTALFGGYGRVWGSVFGALLMSMVVNGAVLLGFPYFYQYVLVGIVILVAVSIYTFLGTRRTA